MKETAPQTVLPILMTGLAITAGVVLSQFAFTRSSRAIIMERDGRRCMEEDGTCIGGLEASHINHSRDKNYNKPENGILLCSLHHLMYHLANRNNPKSIGLRKEHNDWAIKRLEERVEACRDDYNRN